MSEILLCTLNAKHIHASLGLRYLYANLGDLKAKCQIHEFTLDPWPIDIAEQLLANNPRIIGFGIYIWNREKSLQLIRLLKALSPETTLIVGGPEVSYEWQEDDLVAVADYLITGAADLEFAALCEALLNDTPPGSSVIHATPPDLSRLALPYDYYTDSDIENRLIYVEASRGCPFKCEFCLSALDKTAYPFDQGAFFQALEKLHERGVRHYKFVDRTFNLNPNQSGAILDFFLQRMDSDLFLHFEVIPDHLPNQLKEKLQQFPKGTIQLEVGVQSFNPEVQALISRKQNNQKTEQNLTWLREQSHAHLHADLIIGLPGEDIDSFAKGFNQLVSLRPHEVQVGILKRLKGSPIIRHSVPFDMRYNPNPPFNVLSTSSIDFATMQRLNRFARYWEMLANSGRFKNTLALLFNDDPFNQFMSFSQWLYSTTGQVHKFSLKRLFDLIYEAMVNHFGYGEADVLEALKLDYQRTALKGRPQCLLNVELAKNDSEQRPDARQHRQAQHS